MARRRTVAEIDRLARAALGELPVGRTKIGRQGAGEPTDFPGGPEPPPYEPGKSNGPDATRVVTLATERAFPIVGQELPRRPWLVPGLLLRQQVSVMVAPPGSGKSLLVLQIGMAAVAGLSWGGWHPRGQFRVLMINSEEDRDEMRRRLYCAQQQMQIGDDLLGGLSIVSDNSEQFVIARIDARTKTITRTPLLQAIIETIGSREIDCVVVDPFAETFILDENSNSELKWAAILWREVARQTNCAVMLVHHTRKYANSDQAGDADAGRGGGALTGVARVVSTLFGMSEETAEEYGISILDRNRYVRFDDAKSNLSLVTRQAKWFHKVTLTIPNGTDEEAGDEVGVLEPWKPPDVLTEMTDGQVNEILQQLERGMLDEEGKPNGEPYLMSRRGRSGGKKWAGHVLQAAHDMSEAQAADILAKWVTNKLIEERPIITPQSKGREIHGIKVLGRVGWGVKEKYE